jgi:hypothetical protein
MAAFSMPGGPIVTVSDARLSYGEAIQAADEATMKNRRIAPTWGMMFAATDATAFDPVARAIALELGFTGLHDDKRRLEIEQISKAVQRAYENEFSERFFREKLSRFGYDNIADFRSNGFLQMGKDLYHQYAMDLARFDLGLELLVYGFDSVGNHHIFEVGNPGKITSHSLRGHAAIGSGQMMALAALNRKPMAARLPEVIYRLLDAKFSSETARDVGKKTYVIVLHPSGHFEIMPQHEVEKVRDVWETVLKQREPQAALDIIQSSAVTYRGGVDCP